MDTRNIGIASLVFPCDKCLPEMHCTSSGAPHERPRLCKFLQQSLSSRVLYPVSEGLQCPAYELRQVTSLHQKRVKICFPHAQMLPFCQHLWYLQTQHPSQNHHQDWTPTSEERTWKQFSPY